MSESGYVFEGTPSGRVPVVITECFPELHDGTLLTLCRERFGDDIEHIELISVANLRHLVKNMPIMRSLAGYIRGFKTLVPSPGTLVVANGGSHKPIVRALRNLGLRNRVTGVTVNDGSCKNMSTAMIVWSNWLLHGRPTLQTSLADEFTTQRVATLTIPFGIHKIESDQLWCRFAIDQLSYLQEKGLRQVVLVGDILKLYEPFGIIPVGDIITTQQTLQDALPGLTVSLGSLSGKAASVGVKVQRLEFLRGDPVEQSVSTT